MKVIRYPVKGNEYKANHLKFGESHDSTKYFHKCSSSLNSDPDIAGFRTSHSFVHTAVHRSSLCVDAISIQKIETKIFSSCKCSHEIQIHSKSIIPMVPIFFENVLEVPIHRSICLQKNLRKACTTMRML